MIDRPNSRKVDCEQFLSELEALPATEAVDSQELLRRIPASVRQHAEACANCAAALEDFAATRSALAEMKATLPEAGPWFTKRVMAAIGARENEIEERSNSVWISVRRLAPRLAAFSVLLLVLGGTWAVELRRAEQVRKQHDLQPADSLFDGAPNTPLNYDIIASTYEEQP